MSYHEKNCLSLGADDYMRKPIVPEIVRARVHHQLARAEFRDRLESLQHLQVMERAERAVLEQLSILLMVSNTHETTVHLRRTKDLFSLLAEGVATIYPEIVKPEDVGVMARASNFHDIGMAHIPGYLLSKCNTEAADACREIQQHTTFGGTMLRCLPVAPEADRFLALAIEIAECHHEKWNGTGYPHGLGGEDIPASARIMALVDTYDLLTSNRAYLRYRRPLSHVEALALLNYGDELIRPGHFDPYILKVFLQQHDKLSRA
jgi:putative two-component system response regulator